MRKEKETEFQDDKCIIIAQRKQSQEREVEEGIVSTEMGCILITFTASSVNNNMRIWRVWKDLVKLEIEERGQVCGVGSFNSDTVRDRSGVLTNMGRS